MRTPSIVIDPSTARSWRFRREPQSHNAGLSRDAAAPTRQRRRRQRERARLAKRNLVTTIPWQKVSSAFPFLPNGRRVFHPRPDAPRIASSIRPQTKSRLDRIANVAYASAPTPMGAGCGGQPCSKYSMSLIANAESVRSLDVRRKIVGNPDSTGRGNRLHQRDRRRKIAVLTCAPGNAAAIDLLRASTAAWAPAP